MLSILRLPSKTLINTTLPTLTSAGYLFPGHDKNGGVLGTQLNPNVGQMDTLQWGNHTYFTYFDGLELQPPLRASIAVMDYPRAHR